MTPSRHSLRRITALMLVTASGLALLALWCAYLQPVALGGPASYVIVNGTSMEPNLRDGDLAVLRHLDGYIPGQVVAFRAEGGLAIHRVQSLQTDGSYVLKGDNKDATDPWLPRDENVLGAMVLRVPQVGGVYQRFGFAILGIMTGLAVTLVAFAPGGKNRERARPASPAQVEALDAHIAALRRRRESAIEEAPSERRAA